MNKNNIDYKNSRLKRDVKQEKIFIKKLQSILKKKYKQTKKWDKKDKLMRTKKWLKK